ncbi:hypothetical protein Trydic_g12955 [Trypoxylus dichotomus]
MFVFPPLPPKDYVIKEIPRSLISSQEFTPNREVRVTLPEIGKHAVPIPVQKCDLPTKIPFKEVNPAIVKAWVTKDRYNWLVRPGKEDYFIHDVYKKYVVVVCDSYDSRYSHTAPVFPRSFKYELDCLESFRLKKLKQKMQRDEQEDKIRQEKQLKKVKAEVELEQEAAKLIEPTDLPSYPRWQPQPHLFAPSQTDPCIRRAEFALVGRPFKSDACNWYYKNYPPPKIKWRSARFM